MSSSFRTERLGRGIIEALASIVERHTNDPRLHGVTFTFAKVTPDLKQARVLFTYLGDAEDVQRCGEGLARAAGYLRRELARELQLRFAPELFFEFDASVERADRISRLLAGARDHDGSE